MTALLLVLMFVLTIFMVVQFVLRDTISGQDKELEELSIQLSGLATALGLEQSNNASLEDNVTLLESNLGSANDQLTEQSALIASLIRESAEQQQRIEGFEIQVADFETQVAGLLGRQAELETQTAQLTDERDAEISQKEAVQLALAQARGEIDVASEQARLAAAKREAMEAFIKSLETDAAQSEIDLTTLQSELSELEKTRLAEALAAEELRLRLSGAQTEMTAMQLALEERRKDAENTLTLLAAANAAKAVLEQEGRDLNAEIAALTAANGSTLSEKDRLAALLAQSDLLLQQEQQISQNGLRQVELLNQQSIELRQQLASLQELLDTAKAQDIAAQVQIQTLGRDLNTALARVASEQKKLAQEQTKIAEFERAERVRLEAEAKDLKKFKSEFFGQLRDVLGSREGVQIVGDRFVFSSEVLFGRGSAILGDLGKVEIEKVANIILEVANQIPAEIDWVLRVDGHTDNVPLSGTGRFQDNWELSQARALSVVKYLIDDLGLPAQRLAANGFGEFQPIATGSSEEARAQNRRIELKFTEK
jgi:chemotaxis protein MotB